MFAVARRAVGRERATRGPPSAPGPAIRGNHRRQKRGNQYLVILYIHPESAQLPCLRRSNTCGSEGVLHRERRGLGQYAGDDLS